MLTFEEILEPLGIDYNELDKPGYDGEKEELFKMLNDLNVKQVTVEKIREHIATMKASVEEKLVALEAGNQQVLSALSWFIPIIGVVRKWYIDRERSFLIARLENYLLLENLLISPEKAKKDLERLIATRITKVKVN